MHKRNFYTLFDADEYNYFIKNTIKLFRLSQEYRMWLNICNRDTCAATQLTRDNDNIDIEVHHYGLTMWDWVETVLDHFVKYELPVNSFYVGLILSEIHLSDCVTYIPLMHCIHKMIHDDYDSTINKYPSIIDNIEIRDTNRAYQIINNYTDIIKQKIKEE